MVDDHQKLSREFPVSREELLEAAASNERSFCPAFPPFSPSLNPQLETLNPRPEIRNPTPYTRNPEP